MNSLDGYLFQNEIGKGFSSKVYKATKKSNCETVAVKAINNNALKSQFQKTLLQQEIEALKTLDSPSIIKLIEVINQGNFTYIVTEYCEGGDMSNRKMKYSEGSLQTIIQSLVEALKEMSKYKYIHRDIKPANILLKGGLAKLADFGFVTKEAVSTVNVGSPLYMSPEALSYSKYSEKSDIWAVGVSIFELLSGQVPWQAQSERELKIKISQQAPKFNFEISADCEDFLRKCLTVDKEKRISLQEIENHPWIKKPSIKSLMTFNSQKENKKPFQYGKRNHQIFEQKAPIPFQRKSLCDFQRRTLQQCNQEQNKECFSKEQVQKTKRPIF